MLNAPHPYSQGDKDARDSRFGSEGARVDGTRWPSRKLRLTIDAQEAP